MYIEIRPVDYYPGDFENKIFSEICKEFPRFYSEPLVELISNLLFFFRGSCKKLYVGLSCVARKMGTKRYNSFRSTI